MDARLPAPVRSGSPWPGLVPTPVPRPSRTRRSASLSGRIVPAQAGSHSSGSSSTRPSGRRGSFYESARIRRRRQDGFHRRLRPDPELRDVTTVGLADRSHGALENARAWLKSPKVVTHQVDVHKKDELATLMSQYDVGVNTLPDRRTSYLVVDAAVRNGFNFVDILEEYHLRPDAYEVEGLELPAGMTLNQYGDWIHETAVKNHVTFMDGIGFAPGMSNVTCGEGMRKLDYDRVGHRPRRRHPGQGSRLPPPAALHDHVGVLARAARIRHQGQRPAGRQDHRGGRVDPAARPFTFDKLGKTRSSSSAPSRRACPASSSRGPDLKEFAEKTVRWPGHWDGVQTLKECGMLDLDPVEINGVKVVPRDVLLARIEPRLRAQPGETDVCVMYNTVDRHEERQAHARCPYHLWDEADTVNKVSAMGRVTGYSAAIGAVMVAKGMVPETGHRARPKTPSTARATPTSSTNSPSGTSTSSRRWSP